MKNIISFNWPTKTENELQYLSETLHAKKFSGDGSFNQRCEDKLKQHSGSSFVKLTPSCTAALEMAMLVCGIKHGDEVILPSYTFSSTANAILIAGGIPVFIDSKSDDLNIDETLIEKAITPKTKAILPMHYAGAVCEMNMINNIAQKHGLRVIVDAAQAIGSKYHGKPAEQLGDISTLSFHETKNISCGEGGAIFINDQSLHPIAEIIREKGTNRKQFQDGLVDKYTWHEIGSSYLISEFSAAALYAQLEQLDEIIQYRKKAWKFYHDNLSDLELAGKITRPNYPAHVETNGHIYYVIFPDASVRKSAQNYLHENGVQAITHYVPLHSSPAGQKYCKTGSSMKVTDSYAERILRLPMYHGISQSDQTTVIEHLTKFLSG